MSGKKFFSKLLQTSVRFKNNFNLSGNTFLKVFFLRIINLNLLFLETLKCFLGKFQLYFNMLIEMYSLDVSSIKTLFKALGIYFPKKYRSHYLAQPILPEPDFLLQFVKNIMPWNGSRIS